MHFPQRHAKRQTDLGPVGTVTAADLPTSGLPGLILSSGGTPDPTALTSLPPLASGFTLTSSEPAPPTSTPQPLPSATQTSSQALNSSSLSLTTVVAACVGAFAGLALLICIFIWWTRHSSTKTHSRSMPRSPMSENRNAHGETERQQRVRSGAWNKLDEEGGGGGGGEGGEQPSADEDEDEKNFSMFRKRTASMRTTRTAKALEEHGFDMPPITKYHPDLAKELALQEPDRPFTQRQDSGVSWDGETVGDDSFLSLRSVRIESGTMSPTLGAAKMTPTAVPSQLHRWESAEVLTVEEASTAQVEQGNPFTDVAEERRKSSGNPFFGAGDMHRANRRSRSNSRSSLGRSASKSSRSRTRSNIISQGSQIDPFADINGATSPVRELPPFTHGPSDSTTSGTPGYGSERAMKSLIAALDLTQEEVEERLRVVSMQPSFDSRYSTLMREIEDDIGIAQSFPDSPSFYLPTPRP